MGSDGASNMVGCKKQFSVTKGCEWRICKCTLLRTQTWVGVSRCAQEKQAVWKTDVITDRAILLLYQTV